MMKKRFLAAFLAAMMCLLLVLPAQAQREAADAFSGNRTVIFEFDTSDIDNYANGGRAAVDLLLRKSAPDWLTHSLRGTGRTVALTFRFAFESFEDYTEKLAALLAAQPDILYSAGDELMLVETFEATAMLHWLQLALGDSEALASRATVRSDMLTVGEEVYDVTAGVKLLPETAGEMRFLSLTIDTAPKRKGFSRVITVVADGETLESDDWDALVRRAKKAGKVDKVESEGTERLEITLSASNLPALSKLTASILQLPVCLSVNLTAAKEAACDYLFTESFFLDGVLDEDSDFFYTFTCPENMQNVTAAGEESEIIGTEDWFEDEDGEQTVTTTYTVESHNRTSVKFSYTAPFRFDQLRLQTTWDSALSKVTRQITLSTSLEAAEIYHEYIKAELVDEMPKGTTLEMYDEGAVRYYALSFSAWSWDDIADFTEEFVDTKLDCADSWLPFGGSTFTEALTVGGVLDDFDPVYSVQASYRLPGSMDKAADGSLAGGVLTFSDPAGAMEISYQHLHVVKLAMWVVAVAAIVLVVVLVMKRKKAATPPAPEAKTTPTAEVAPETEVVTQ